MLRKPFLILALAALTACNKAPDNPDPGTGTPPAEVPALTFTYANPLGAATYSGTVPASAAEKVVRDLDVFLFLADGTFVCRLTEATDYTSENNGETTTLTLSPELLSAHAGQEAVFYFVANNNASTGGKHIAAFSGTEAEFADLPTSPLPPSNNPYTPHLAQNIALNPSTGGLLMTGRSNPIRFVGRRTETVTLKRRTARFDIQNHNWEDGLAIDNVFISQAAVQAPLFGHAPVSHAFATRSTEAIWGPDPWDYNEQGIAESWFYLYPTDLGTTEITIQVRNSNNEYKYYRVDSDIDIEANKRYRLIYRDDAFVVTDTGDWGEGGKTK